MFQSTVYIELICPEKYDSQYIEGHDPRYSTVMAKNSINTKYSAINRRQRPRSQCGGTRLNRNVYV